VENKDKQEKMRGKEKKQTGKGEKKQKKTNLNN